MSSLDGVMTTVGNRAWFALRYKNPLRSQSSENKDVCNGGKCAKKRPECANSMKCSFRWKKNVYFLREHFTDWNVQILRGRTVEKICFIFYPHIWTKTTLMIKRFSVSLVLFWLSILFFFWSTNKPCFYLTDCLNVSDMDLNPFLMLIWGC